MGGGIVRCGEDATAELSIPIKEVPQRLPPEPTHEPANNFVRIAHDGERYLPHRFRDGLYRAADPALGRIKHHAKNQIAIRGEEIEGYLQRGFLLRMRGEISGQVNLIAASEVTMAG